MVEMLGVLAIIGVLSVGGIAGYSKAMTKFKINKSMDQISMLVASIRTLYSGQRNYAGFDNENALSFGIVPNEMDGGDNSTITNAFAGSVAFGTAAQNGNNDAAFTITYNGLGKEACVTMATADWGSGSSSGLISMSISSGGAGGGGAEADADAPAAAAAGDFTGNKLPISLTNAADKCDCDEPTCSITWVYL